MDSLSKCRGPVEFYITDALLMERRLFLHKNEDKANRSASVLKIVISGVPRTPLFFNELNNSKY